jgi:hypothetical protein
MEYILSRVTPAVSWIALVCVVGLFTGAASAFHWVVLASLAAIPPAFARALSRVSVLTPAPCRREILR